MIDLVENCRSVFYFFFYGEDFVVCGVLQEVFVVYVGNVVIDFEGVMINLVGDCLIVFVY